VGGLLAVDLALVRVMEACLTMRKEKGWWVSIMTHRDESAWKGLTVQEYRIEG
jgi:hypothetical protein